MSHIFISYSRKDKDYAFELAGKLRNDGFEVWIDDRIQSGDDWWDTIDKAISDAIAFIVIMTPSSKDSNWVKREILLADDRKKPVFPLLLEGENWSFYVHTQYENLSNYSLPTPVFVERLRQAIAANQQDTDAVSGNILRHDGVYMAETDDKQFHFLYFSEDNVVRSGTFDTYTRIADPKVLRSKAGYQLQHERISFEFTINLDADTIFKTTYSGYVEHNRIILEYEFSGVKNVRAYDFLPLLTE